MDSSNLVDYLGSTGVLPPDMYEALKYELEGRLYHYGEQFAAPRERCDSLATKVRGFIRHTISLARTYAGSGSQNLTDVVVSSAYFTVNDELRRQGVYAVQPPWAGLSQSLVPFGERELRRRALRMRQRLEQSRFADLVTEAFRQEARSFRDAFKLACQRQKAKALIVANDVAFFETVAIQAFRDLGRPSIIFLHGLPARYNRIDESRADYLAVWGEAIKRNYVSVGFDPKRILVVGHPWYSSLPTVQPVGGSDRLRDVLVLSKALEGNLTGDGTANFDRGVPVRDLFSVRDALRRAGLRSARVRFHPSMNPRWMEAFMGDGFFVVDRLPLADSLRQATTVVGPTSTVLLEALAHSRNYLVYEPPLPTRETHGLKLVPPFDGSTAGIPVARTPEELTDLLMRGELADPAVLRDYIKMPFDLTPVVNLLRS